MSDTATPAVEGWFTTGPEPALIGTSCRSCGTISFPRETTFCKNPSCSGEEFDDVELSRFGKVWSYTDAQYQPPAPYIASTDPYVPFALAAVELPEGLVVLGQVADGYGVADLKVGNPVELVIETLYTDETGERSTWRWKPVAAAENGAQA
ncbi:benzoylsuccinyl-CoA thiolase [Rhodococcus sp. ABRD24]|uniref:Zn-ribbon domain-containing OB-fold protein n=1 Tax=Rhodococcus sp. ABRD24 TaxID=2507582 RepID=UPI00103E27B3|nr:OB-fold domain-containing protein [Rhodococcus sp. ABRD24]QBJ94758.1 benzoylsuccinyl-CoA thiolase [Rhodococcus sp. ABRD24]